MVLPLPAAPSVRFLLSSAALVLAAACSSSSSDAQTGASGLARDRSVASLSDAEAAELCDWSLATEGGAGKRFDCGGGESRVVHTRAECLDDVATLKKLEPCYAVRVGELEDCSIAEGKDACGRAPACTTINDRLEACAKR